VCVAPAAAWSRCGKAQEAAACLVAAAHTLGGFLCVCVAPAAAWSRCGKAQEAAACLVAAAHTLGGFCVCVCVLLLQQLGAGVARRRKLLLAS